jgi:cell division protein FtsB
VVEPGESMARRRRSAPRPKLVLRWLAVLVIVLCGFAYVHPLRSYLDARAAVAERQQEVGELENRSRELERRVELAGTEEFVVREARRLGLVRPGERLFIVKGIEAWKKARVR